MKIDKLQKIRKNKVRKLTRYYIKFNSTPFLLLLVGIMLGAIIGITCVLFQILPDTILACIYASFQSSDHDFTAYASIFLVCGLLASFAIGITITFAPEAGGSGIPEIEGALDHKRPIRWKRVLPVKLLGGISSLSSGMILGREGPSIQIGGNLGKMIADLFFLSKSHAMSLVAAGGAAGLASAFNAPLAGILFVLEELRPQFRYSFLSIKIVSITVISASVTRCFLVDNLAVFKDLPNYICPNVGTFYWFALFGIIVGVIGYLFNKNIEKFQNFYSAFFKGKLSTALPFIFVVGGCFGIIFVSEQQAAGSGMISIPLWITKDQSIQVLLLLLIWRIFGTLLCFGSGIPGGIFAPSLAIGTLLGALFGTILGQLGITDISPGIFAIVGMSTLFAASVRAPVTGIILVTEMTNNYEFLLPMMISTLCATLTAQKMGGKPIYTQILERTLRITEEKKHRQLLNERASNAINS